MKKLSRLLKRAGIILALASVTWLGDSTRADSLTTLFAANNGQNGNMFDLTAKTDLTISGFDINLWNETGSNPPCLVEVYWKPGSFRDSERTPSAWNLLGSATVTSEGLDVPTPLPIGGLSMLAGQTNGIYITTTCPVFFGSLEYTDLHSNGAMDTYQNDNLRLDWGVGVAYPFGSGNPDIFSPRVWNGTVYYEVVPEPSAFALASLGATLLVISRQRTRSSS
jgi:hypothetical protein